MIRHALSRSSALTCDTRPIASPFHQRSPAIIQRLHENVKRVSRAFSPIRCIAPIERGRGTVTAALRQSSRHKERSEERRVGKKCISVDLGGWPTIKTKKNKNI